MKLLQTPHSKIEQIKILCYLKTDFYRLGYNCRMQI